jgi:glycosyltransferase involved in cell wall biosynthesis
VAEALVNVFKVDFWDLEEMTNKIVALLRHRELLEELGRRGREELDLPRFSLAEPARLTEEAYRRALGSPKPDPINQTATHEGRCA